MNKTFSLSLSWFSPPVSLSLPISLSLSLSSLPHLPLSRFSLLPSSLSNSVFSPLLTTFSLCLSFLPLSASSSSLPPPSLSLCHLPLQVLAVTPVNLPPATIMPASLTSPSPSVVSLTHCPCLPRHHCSLHAEPSFPGSQQDLHLLTASPPSTFLPAPQPISSSPSRASHQSTFPSHSRTRPTVTPSPPPLSPSFPPQIPHLPHHTQSATATSLSQNCTLQPRLPCSSQICTLSLPQRLLIHPLSHITSQRTLVLGAVAYVPLSDRPVFTVDGRSPPRKTQPGPAAPKTPWSPHSHASAQLLRRLPHLFRPTVSPASHHRSHFSD